MLMAAAGVSVKEGGLRKRIGVPLQLDLAAVRQANLAPLARQADVLLRKSESDVLYGEEIASPPVYYTANISLSHLAAPIYFTPYSSHSFFAHAHGNLTTTLYLQSSTRYFTATPLI
jgi:hypothetical protein